MFTKLLRRLAKVSRRFVIAATLIAVVVIGGLALWLMRGDSKVGADADLEPRAARIERIEGDVQMTRVDDEDWAEATLNAPVEVGDRIYARDDSHCSVALTGHNFVRLNPETSLDVLALGDQRTQLALRGGSAFFDVGALESDELYEVATPSGAVDFNEPGLYQIGMQDGNVIVSVLSGLAQVIGEGGAQEINEGEVITLLGSTAAQAISSKLTPTLGGEIVDDYYRSRYPTRYDGRYRDYSSYVSDPFYYDPYRSSQSCRYVSADVPGIYDLDDYGDWTNVSGYGNCWAPRVGAGWAPFREGSWNIDGPWGPTWVSTEPWGWAPYHYGRWTFAQQRWFWVPRDVARRPAYCAAPVAFIPLRQTAQIAWVPLAPGEPFVQRYYDRSFQPRYLAPNQVIREERLRRTFANFDSPSALTVVPVQSMGRLVDSRTIANVDPREVARNQAVLDPFSIADVRQIALRNQERRRRIKLAPDEQESLNRQVITSTRPVALPARDLNKAFHIAQLPDGRKKDRMKAGTLGQVVDSRSGDGLPKIVARPDSVGKNANERDQQVTALADRANQGDKSARRELRELRRETRQGAANQPNQVIQQEQLRQQKQQSKLERQQKAAAAGQQDSSRRAQMEQVEAQRKEKQLRLQQETGNQQSQPAKQEQRKQLKEESRMQRAQQEAAQQTQRQMRQQQKQQKRQERKPPQASAEPVQRRQGLRNETAQLQRAQQAQAAAQQRQQLKAQRHEQQRAMNEQQSRSVAMQASQQAANAQAREQMKAQRRIERQQSPPPTVPVTQSAPVQSQRKAEKAKRKNDGN